MYGYLLLLRSFISLIDQIRVSGIGQSLLLILHIIFWAPSLIRFLPIDSRSYTHPDLIYSVRNVPGNTQVYIVSPDLSVSFASSISFINYFGFRRSFFYSHQPYALFSA